MSTPRLRRTAVACGLLAVTGCASATPLGAPEPTTTRTAGATASPSASGTPSAAPSNPAPSPARTAARAPVLRPGDRGPQVRAAQTRLRALGYWLGPVDGRYGDLTQQAVVALQKVAGLARDGVLGPRTTAALDAGRRPAGRSTSGHVVEVDKAHQVVLVVDGGRVSLAFNTSTGSGDYYDYRGERHHAVTPSGAFTITRQVDGVRVSHLGRLYRPKYFNGGIALHGYGHVPAYPASHGCVRVSDAAIDHLWERHLAPVGTRVLVY